MRKHAERPLGNWKMTVVSVHKPITMTPPARGSIVLQNLPAKLLLQLKSSEATEHMRLDIEEDQPT